MEEFIDLKLVKLSKKLQMKMNSKSNLSWIDIKIIRNEILVIKKLKAEYKKSLKTKTT